MSLKTKIFTVLALIVAAGMSYDLYLGLVVYKNYGTPVIAARALIIGACLFYAIKNLTAKKQ